MKSTLAACAILAIGACQLITPADVPVLSENFRLVAHVESANISEFTAGIENWEVTAMPSTGCHAPLILKKPSERANQTSGGTTFFFNPTLTEIQYEQATATGRLSIPRGGHGQRDVGMDCRKGTAQVGVVYVDRGPQLVHTPTGTFYVCPRRIRGEAVAQLLFREKQDEPLPYTCADVALIAKLAAGKSHGDDSLVACCTDVRDGECLLSSPSAGATLTK